MCRAGRLASDELVQAHAARDRIDEDVDPAPCPSPRAIATRPRPRPGAQRAVARGVGFDDRASQALQAGIERASASLAAL